MVSKALPVHAYVAGIQTQWCARVQTLHQKYGFLTHRENKATEQKTAVRTQVHHAGDTLLSAAAQKRVAVALCPHTQEQSSLNSSATTSAVHCCSKHRQEHTAHCPTIAASTSLKRCKPHCAGHVGVKSEQQSKSFSSAHNSHCN